MKFDLIIAWAHNALLWLSVLIKLVTFCDSKIANCLLCDAFIVAITYELCTKDFIILFSSQWRPMLAIRHTLGDIYEDLQQSMAHNR